MTAIDLEVSPLGRVEGDLDLHCTIEDGVVTQAYTEALMFRGFEIILRGKDPQAGLIMTPRICGICGGSHLTKACYAIDTAWKTVLPPNGILLRNIGQACETLQSIPRWFYAIFAIDLVNKKYAKTPSYGEAMRRFAPFVGESYEPGVVLVRRRSDHEHVFLGPLRGADASGRRGGEVREVVGVGGEVAGDHASLDHSHTGPVRGQPTLLGMPAIPARPCDESPLAGLPPR